MPDPTLTRMVRVRWIDTQSDAWGWTPLAELDPTPCVVTTVGTLVEPSPRPGHVTVVLSWHGGDICDSAAHVPERCIINVETLVVGD